jgi:hypothetical protein
MITKDLGAMNRLASSRRSAPPAGSRSRRVRLELAHEPVNEIYPALTLHIKSCPECKELFEVEFHRQGLQQQRRCGRRDGADSGPAGAATCAAIVGLARGAMGARGAWIDRATGSWRQVELALAQLARPQESLPALQGCSVQGMNLPPLRRRSM